MRRRPVFLLGACVLAVSLAACSGGDDSSSAANRRPAGTSTSTTTSTTATTTTAPTTSTTPANLSAVRVTLTRVAATQNATAMAIAPNDRSLYIAEQGGRVRAVRDGALDPTPVLDLTGKISSGGERGLLGLTFSPDGSKLYVDYTNPQ